MLEVLVSCPGNSCHKVVHDSGPLKFTEDVIMKLQGRS